MASDEPTPFLQDQMHDEIARWSEFYGIDFSAKEGLDLAKALYRLSQEYYTHM